MCCLYYGLQLLFRYKHNISIESTTFGDHEKQNMKNQISTLLLYVKSKRNKLEITIDID